MTRRQTIVSVGGALVGSGVLSEAAFADSTSASADLRVVVESDLDLLPARENNNYVETDENGLVKAITLDHEGAKPNQRAKTVFENLVALQNNGDITVEELYFSVEVTGTDSDGEIEDALKVVSDSKVLSDDGDLFEEHTKYDELGSGERLSFGLRLGLLENVTEIPEDADVTLKIDPKR